MNNALIIIAGIAIVIIVVAFLFTSKLPRAEATIISKSGEEKLKLEVQLAMNLMQKSKGLMFVDNIEENEGMVFFMGLDNKENSFWMKNVNFDIDALGIEGNTIVQIERMETCKGKECKNYFIKGDKVLELKAGVVEKYNIKEGDLFFIESRR